MKKISMLYLLLVLIFSTTFYFGVYANPNFDLHDFCLGLSTEFLGLVIALVVVDKYILEKKQRRKKVNKGA